jgi:Fe-Mn family superoxide dismutase
LKDHFKLYEGYVKNTNALADETARLVEQGKAGEPVFSELKRRYGWEYNGMRLHELYFRNFGGEHETQARSFFQEEIKAAFGSWERWKDEFLGAAAMRGIGWVVLYKDVLTGRLQNCWIDEHNTGHLVGSDVLLVLDVFEHAFITDYGMDRKKYVSNFFDQINWGVVEDRFIGELKGE